MIKRFLSVFLFLATAFSASAVEDIFVTDTMSLSGEMELRQLYLRALCFKKQNRVDSAMMLLDKYLEKDKTNGAVYMDIANMYISLGNFKEALANMREAAKLEPDNYWIRRSEALLLIQNGQTNEGLLVYNDLVKSHPDKVEDVEALARLYYNVNRKRESLDMWNHYEKMVGISQPVSLQKFDLLYALGEKKHAEAVLDSLIATDRTIPDFYMVKATSLGERGETKKAEKQFAQIKKMFPNTTAMVDKELALMYLGAGQNKKCVEAIKRVLASPDFDFESKRTLLLGSLDTEQISSSFGKADFESLIKQYPHNEQACLIYSDYLLSKNDAQGIDYLRKASEINPKNELVWEALLNYYSQIQTEQYLPTLEAAYKELPNSGRILFYKGSAAMSADEKQGAEYWERAVKELSKDRTMNFKTSVVYGLLGDYYYTQKKDTALAFAAYDSALVYNSNNYDVLNNFAYFLADYGRDLEKAERMSGRTIAANPKSVSCLDTYAWIFFKMGKISTAKLYIEQAVMLGGEKDSELMEHYGDILYADGMKADAQKAWQKACSLTENPSEKLKKKAETGVYVE